jgi:hypothetical protein
MCTSRDLTITCRKFPKVPCKGPVLSLIEGLQEHLKIFQLNWKELACVLHRACKELVNLHLLAIFLGPLPRHFKWAQSIEDLQCPIRHANQK